MARQAHNLEVVGSNPTPATKVERIMSMATNKEKDREEYTKKILDSDSNKKVIVAGPGTGKTFTFGEYLKKIPGNRENKIVMTFINPLVDDLNSDLGEKAIVRTFDGFVKKECEEHNLIKSDEQYFLGANKIISEDHDYIFGTKKDFSHLFNTLDIENESEDIQNFVKKQNEFYKFVDPSVIKYRLYDHFNKHQHEIPRYDVVIIDEFQDFNKLEAKIVVEHLSKNILLAGDDDQVLFEFKGSNPDCIRELFNKENDYESFTLPYCSRCPASVVKFVNRIIEYSKKHTIFPADRCDKQYLPFREEEISSVKFVPYGMGSMFPIERELKDIRDRNASVLILHPYGATNEAERLYEYLTLRGFKVNRKKKEVKKKVFEALDTLSNDQRSNLGWRIILPFLFSKSEVKKMIKRCYDENKNIFDIVEIEYKQKVKDVITVIQHFKSSKTKTPTTGQSDTLLKLFNMEASKIGISDDRKNKIREMKRKYLGYKLNNTLTIEMCNIGNSKGLSADYVFIYPFSKQHFKLQYPQDIYNIVVALTRTKKKLLIFEPEENSQQSAVKDLYEESAE